MASLCEENQQDAHGALGVGNLREVAWYRDGVNFMCPSDWKPVPL